MRHIIAVPPILRPSTKKNAQMHLIYHNQSTCIRSVVLESELALWMRYVCSMYSVSR